jgi:hypothetical protein
MPENRPMPLSGDNRIPDDPLLGKPVDNFPSRRLRAMLVGWSILISSSLLLNYALIEIDAFWVAPFVVVTVGLMGLVIGWWVLNQWNREVILFQKGFTYREGSEDVRFAYTEIVSIRLRAEQLAYFFGLYRRIIYRITLRMRSSDIVILDNTYSRVEQLGDQLNKHIFEHVRPTVHDKLNNGEPVYFSDDVYLTTEGIHVDPNAVDPADAQNLTLPWAEFSGYKAAQRHLNFLLPDSTVWYAVPLSEIDNLILFLEILREKQAPKQEQPQ